jgi:hypothetical protein
MQTSALSRTEIVRRGEEIYERDLRSHLEPASNGQFLVLDIDTGEYELDPDETLALQRAITKCPEGTRFIKRVGFSAAHRLCSKFDNHRLLMRIRACPGL